MLVAFICALCVSIILCGVSVYISKTNNVLLLLLKSLAPISCLILALVSANLSSSFGGWTIFVALALALNILTCIFSLVTDSRTSSLTLGVVNTLTLVCFALAGIIDVIFNAWTILFGIGFGLFATLLILVFKKYRLPEIIVLGLNFVTCGFAIGQGITLLLSTVSITSAILFFVATLLSAVYLTYHIFAKKERFFNIVSEILKFLPLILFASSIYFL